MAENIKYAKVEEKNAYGGPLFQIIVADFGTLLYVEVSPGQTKMPHYHKVTTETFFVVEGEGKCFINGQAYELSRGVKLTISPNLPHTISNDGSKNLKLIAFKSHPYSDDNPDKHKDCPDCNGIINLDSGEWRCSVCKKKYSVV